jgi:ribosomal protein S18 acetylase RimI-like enzyme
MFIRTAEAEDLPAIAALERTVEDPRLAASVQVLHDRLRLFPEGFLVAVSDDRVVGYLESIRWDGPSFERFDEIKDYERMHRALGSVLYIAFMAVDPAYRRRGFASQLLQAVAKMAASRKIKKIQLVALPKLVGFYGTAGFRRVRTLPHFLENSAGELLEKDLENQ